MKLASLIPYKIMPPQKGGEKAIYYFIRALAAQTPVTACTVTENAGIDIDNVTTIDCLGSATNKLRYINPFRFFRIKKQLKKKQLNTLIIEHPYFGWLGILLKICSGIKLVVRSHNIESARFRTLGKWWWPVLYRYERLVHRKACLSLFITEEDRQYAITHFKLDAQKTILCTYGIGNVAAPGTAAKEQCKKDILQTHQLPDKCKILLFAAPLQYRPNLDALNGILERINPLLIKQLRTPYRIIICGGGLPAAYAQLQQYPNMIYAGFVKDINSYFKGADLFLNPVVDGGGIKTKLVEALAAGTGCVSYRNGAIGVPQEITGGQLRLADNNDVPTFVHEVLQYLDDNTVYITPAAFFDHFNWQRIIERVLISLNNI